MNKHAVTTIITKIDADLICKRLDVKQRSIRLARERGVFPASWFDPLERICAANGVDCPRDAFNWKSPADEAVS